MTDTTTTKPEAAAPTFDITTLDTALTQAGFVHNGQPAIQKAARAAGVDARSTKRAYDRAHQEGKAPTPSLCGKLAAVLPGTPFAEAWAAFIPAGAAATAEPSAAADMPAGMRLLPLDHIAPSRFNPRREFAQADLEALAADIRQRGLIQNITVRRPTGDTAEISALRPAEILSGERRYRACCLLRDRGHWPPEQHKPHGKVMVMVRDCDDTEARAIALVENMQRADLTPLEEARAFVELAEMGLTTGDIATRICRTTKFVTNRMALETKLTDEARMALAENRLTLEQARGVASIPREYQNDMLIPAEGCDSDIDVRRRAVADKPKLSDMAFDLDQWGDSPVMKVDGETYLMNVERAKMLQEAEADRLAERLRGEGWYDVTIEKASWFYGTETPPGNMGKSEVRATIYLVTRYGTGWPVLKVQYTALGKAADQIESPAERAEREAEETRERAVTAAWIDLRDQVRAAMTPDTAMRFQLLIVFAWNNGTDFYWADPTDDMQKALIDIFGADIVADEDGNFRDLDDIDIDKAADRVLAMSASAVASNWCRLMAAASMGEVEQTWARPRAEAPAIARIFGIELQDILRPAPDAEDEADE